MIHGDWRPSNLISYARLEWRRNIVLHLGWPLFILASLPFSMLIARLSGQSAATGLYAALFGWTTMGLPFSALLVGAVTGAGLRGRAEEDEACLPVSHARRVNGAALAAAATLAVCATLVLAVAALAPPGAPGMSPYQSVLAGAGPTAAWGLGLAWALFTTLVASFALESGILGVVAALFLPFPAALAAMVPLVFYDDLAVRAVLASAFAAGALAAVRRAARLPHEARRPWKALLLIALLPAGAELAAAMVLVTTAGLWALLFGRF